MNKIFIAAVLALALAGGAIASGASQNTSYVAKNPPLTIWCKDGGHNYTPIGDPSDYGEDPVDSTLSWLFSGEPECLPGDKLWGEEDDHGWGGAAICVAGTINGEDCGDHRTHELIATATDDYGTPYLNIRAETCDGTEGDCTTSNNKGENVYGEGCGSAGITIPDNIPRHWQSPVDTPTYLLWIFVHGAYVDQTSGAVCLGSTGVLTADF